MDDLTGARRVALGTAATFLAQGFKALTQIAGQLALTRLLMPGDFGLIAMVAPALAFVQVFADLGLAQAIIQRTEVTQAQLSSLFWRTFAASCALCAGIAIAAPAIAWLYREPRTIPITLSLAVLVLASGLTMQQSALLVRRLRFSALAVMDGAAPLAGIAAGLAAATMGAGVWSLVIMQVVQSLTVLVLVWGFSSWRPSRPMIDGSDLELLRFGSHQAGFNFTQFLTTSADNVLIGLVNGKIPLGYYDRSYNLVVRPSVLLTAPLERVAIPILSRLLAQPTNYRSVFLALMQAAVFLVVPGLLFGIFFADPLIELLLGPKWQPIVPIFRWLSLGAIAAPLYASTAWLFVSQGLVARQLRLGVTVALLNILSFAIGIFWGPIGVAICSAISFAFFQTPLICWAATGEGPVRRSDFLAGVIPSAAGATAVLIAGLCIRSSAVTSILGLCLAAGMAYLIFGSTAALFPQCRDSVVRAFRLVRLD